jgi:hypothetical protein
MIGIDQTPLMDATALEMTIGSHHMLLPGAAAPASTARRRPA